MGYCAQCARVDLIFWWSWYNSKLVENRRKWVVSIFSTVSQKPNMQSPSFLPTSPVRKKTNWWNLCWCWSFVTNSCLTWNEKLVDFGGSALKKKSKVLWIDRWYYSVLINLAGNCWLTRYVSPLQMRVRAVERGAPLNRARSRFILNN